MKADVLIVPNDTLLVSVRAEPLGSDGPRFDGRLAPELLTELLRAAFGPESEAVQVRAQLLVSGVGSRMEPLYPAPDDLLAEPGPKDAVWSQPSYLEMVPGDVVKHDLGALRLLTPSSRNAKARSFDGYLTRKGVKVWAERKPQRLSESEHYLPQRRLFELEERLERRGESTVVATHLRLKPGIGILLTLEGPEGAVGFKEPKVVRLERGARTVRLEPVQVPQPSLDIKPKKRWRLCLLSTQAAGPKGLPNWIEPEQLGTQAPLPEGGKLIAVARRIPEQELDGALPASTLRQPRALIPVGTTYFLEFNEPVRIEQSAEILAGGA